MTLRDKSGDYPRYPIVSTVPGNDVLPAELPCVFSIHDKNPGA